VQCERRPSSALVAFKEPSPHVSQGRGPRTRNRWATRGAELAPAGTTWEALVRSSTSSAASSGGQEPSYPPPHRPFSSSSLPLSPSSPPLPLLPLPSSPSLPPVPLEECSAHPRTSPALPAVLAPSSWGAASCPLCLFPTVTSLGRVSVGALSVCCCLRLSSSWEDPWP